MIIENNGETVYAEQSSGRIEIEKKLCRDGGICVVKNLNYQNYPNPDLDGTTSSTYLVSLLGNTSRYAIILGNSVSSYEANYVKWNISISGGPTYFATILSDGSYGGGNIPDLNVGNEPKVKISIQKIGTQIIFYLNGSEFILENDPGEQLTGSLGITYGNLSHDEDDAFTNIKTSGFDCSDGGTTNACSGEEPLWIDSSYHSNFMQSSKLLCEESSVCFNLNLKDNNAPINNHYYEIALHYEDNDTNPGHAHPGYTFRFRNGVANYIGLTDNHSNTIKAYSFLNINGVIQNNSGFPCLTDGEDAPENLKIVIKREAGRINFFCNDNPNPLADIVDSNDNPLRLKQTITFLIII